MRNDTHLQMQLLHPTLAYISSSIVYFWKLPEVRVDALFFLYKMSTKLFFKYISSIW